MGVTSGKGHLMPWRTVAHFQQQREDPLTPNLILPCPSPPATPPSLGAQGAALNTTTEVLLCRITKHSRCYKTFFFDKTVIIIIILYNTVPVRIHSKSLHVPQLLKYLVNYSRNKSYKYILRTNVMRNIMYFEDIHDIN